TAPSAANAAGTADGAGQVGQWGLGGFAPDKPCAAPPTAPDCGLPPDICPGVAGEIPDLPCSAEISPTFPAPRGTPRASHAPPPAWKDYRNTALGCVEKGYLQHLLLASGGNITRAARMAGLSRQRLYALLRKHGVMRQWVDDAAFSKQ
ncbi:helix-turn-helix domain-containing protein, partial [Nitratidesulfovibrio liaohensis]|uniref:helix-turn-helix domain-containing protein n=1 Tax=Nitratidesulfovibrio liaohensis TaxID=2604158 RepID=UPI002444854B